MRRISLLAPLPLLLAAALPAPAQDPPILKNQVAVHGASRMRAMTTTRDGRWLFQSEGATMVFVLTGKAAGRYDRAAFAKLDGNKRVPIGQRGVLAARMALDPAAGSSPGPNRPGNVRSLLYIAGGRDGLWIMEADTGAHALNKAWRVDDSQSGDPAVQDSKRWCADVGFARVGGTDYVVALFGSKGNSRLRLYRLADVRAIADPAAANSETGHELAPVLDVLLGDHPNAPTPPAPTFGRSVAVSMAIDSFEAQQRADAYVAMGHNGLVRVALDGGPVPTATRTWGPVFGDGTPYSLGIGIPPGKSGALYGNFVLEGSERYADPDPITRNELPFFADVDVFRGTTATQTAVHHLYVAVDHLYWMVFDLGGRPFGPATPILHHEGQELAYTQQWGTRAQRVVSATQGGNQAACAREIEVVNHPVHGPFVFVTTAWINYIKDYTLYTNEGHVFDADLEWGGGPGRIPSKNQTYWYALRDSWPAGTNYLGTIAQGGSTLHVPDRQELPAQLVFFHQYRTTTLPEVPIAANGVGMTIVRATPAGPGAESYVRAAWHGAGRQSFALGTSLLDDQLVFTGENDGGVPKDGFLVTGATKFQRWYDIPASPPRADERPPGGFFFDSESQWQEPGQAFNRQYLFCSGANRAYDEGTPPFWTQIRWMLYELRVPGLDARANEPVRERWWYFTPPRDRFGNIGFLWYMNAHSSRDFHDYLDGLGGHPERLAFGTRARTAEGLTVIDRDELQAYALGQAHGADIHLDNGGIATTSPLVTHPEFNDMPRNNQLLKDYWQGNLDNSDPTSRALTWGPQLIEVQQPNSSSFGRWVLAVPCSQIQADPEWDIYDDPSYGNPAWLPDAGTLWSQKRSHGLVQFWEVSGNPYWPVTYTDPGLDKIPGNGDDVSGNSPLRKIVAPNADSNFWHVEPLRMPVGGTDRVFLFCVDFTGHLYVYSIENLLDVMPANPSHPVQGVLDDATHLVGEWSTPKSTFDDLPTNLFDVAIDYRGGDRAIVYAAVRRVGVVALRFDPGAAQPQNVLRTLDTIQTADFAVNVQVRESDGTLLVNDYGGGIRMYRE